MRLSTLAAVFCTCFLLCSGLASAEPSEGNSEIVFLGYVADKHVSLIGALTRDFGFDDLGAKVGGKIDFFALVVDGICVGNIVGDGAVSKGSYVECLVEQGNSSSVKNEISDKHSNSWDGMSKGIQSAFEKASYVPEWRPFNLNFINLL